VQAPGGPVSTNKEIKIEEQSSLADYVSVASWTVYLDSWNASLTQENGRWVTLRTASTTNKQAVWQLLITSAGNVGPVPLYVPNVANLVAAAEDFAFSKIPPGNPIKRVHLHLGLMAVLFLLAWLLFGIDFVVHAIGVIPPLMETIPLLRQLSTPPADEKAAKQQREDYRRWVLYWILFAWLAVVESFCFAEDPVAESARASAAAASKTKPAPASSSSSSSSSGGCSWMFCLFQIFHLFGLLWAAHPKFKGSVVVFDRVVVPLEARVSALLSGPGLTTTVPASGDKPEGKKL